ncbi:hypothetical protein GQ602_004566 [Ophiocordyceps camponoti-floridani]|uniref:Uncharacterized protein n=1 Tax=Ophiocordyceps camponoti-floridani TaxID=2030778 RepID=A0A8H4VDW6_9HYPO|nr:hypothetical protein GQ602_004566 [Ophiocordyceps camponoti-floridani]
MTSQRTELAILMADAEQPYDEWSEEAPPPGYYDDVSPPYYELVDPVHTRRAQPVPMATLWEAQEPGLRLDELQAYRSQLLGMQMQLAQAANTATYDTDTWETDSFSIGDEEPYTRIIRC